MSIWLLYLALGAVAGLFAGLFGIGGGLIIVPALIAAFSAQGIAPEVLTHMAVGTSLATILFTSLNAVHEHHRQQAVDWHSVAIMAPGLIVGSWLGAGIAHALDGTLLQLLFGVFAILLSAQMFRGKSVAPHRAMPGHGVNSAVGVTTGVASGLFGIGGGSLLVPWFHWHNIVMQRAVATSAACGLFIALAGAGGFIVNGWQAPTLPQWSLGYVYLPALLGIALASMLFSRIGARLAHKLPATTLRKLFAVLLCVVGLKLVIGASIG